MSGDIPRVIGRSSRVIGRDAKQVIIEGRRYDCWGYECAIAPGGVLMWI